MTKHQLFTAEQLEDIRKEAISLYYEGATASLDSAILLPENISQDGVVVLYDIREGEFIELEFTYDTLNPSSTAASLLGKESDEVGYILIRKTDDGTLEIADVIFGCEYKTTIEIQAAFTDETLIAIEEAKAHIEKGFVQRADSREHNEASYSFAVNETPITIEMALKSFG